MPLNLKLALGGVGGGGGGELAPLPPTSYAYVTNSIPRESEQSHHGHLFYRLYKCTHACIRELIPLLLQKIIACDVGLGRI